MTYSNKTIQDAIRLLRICCFTQRSTAWITLTFRFTKRARNLAFAMFMAVPDRLDDDMDATYGEAAQLLAEGYLPDDEFCLKGQES